VFLAAAAQPTSAGAKSLGPREEISLQRSEVFGRGTAESLQLGVDVIATAYGGNTDFCCGPLAHPVRCREVPIPRGAYPSADGHVWGEPDLEHAAEPIQQVAARRLAGYRERLEELWARRQELAGRLKWRADTPA